MKVLLFAPYAKVWQHVVLESQLERLLTGLGHEVIIVQCFESFISFCHMHESSGLKVGSSLSERKEICGSCSNNALAGQKKSSVRQKLIEYVQEQDKHQIEKFVNNLNNSNLEVLSFDGYPVGKIALAEIVLRYKKRDFKLSPDQFEHFKKILENIITTILAGKRLLSSIQPDVVLGLNPGYAVPASFYRLAMTLGFRTLYLAGGPSIDDLSKSVTLWDFQKYGMANPAKEIWDHNNYVPTRKDCKKVKLYFKKLRSSKLAWTYSSAPKKLSSREFFKIPKESKLFLLAMNSFDEVIALGLLDNGHQIRFQSGVFQTQIEWVQFTKNYFRDNPNDYLIIRPHPREMPNKREGQISESAHEWKNFLLHKPNNVIIDSPELGFSIYDHFDDIDALITGWSSTAIEAMHLGIPVITYDSKLPGFPSALAYSGRSREDYVSNLDKILKSTPRINPSQSESWLAFHNYAGSIYLGGGLLDRYPFNLITRGSLLHRALAKLIPSAVQKLDMLMPASRQDQELLGSIITGKLDNLYIR
jgi:hypothetical protein